jgi:peptidoglycan/xylan/chitin deacetylase (PgdA/CDA1 family)
VSRRAELGGQRAALTAAVLAAGALALHAAPGVVAWRSARCRLLPNLSGVGRAGHVALTFDDGPDPRSTPRVLDELDRLGWRATFFCLGSQAARSPGLVTELVARGHEVGLHGYEHRSHMRRPAAPVVDDVLRSSDLLGELTGSSPRWLRPPYGALSLSSIAAARRCGLQLILWTTWGLDWEPGATGSSVAHHIRSTWWRGPTVLLHDSDLTSARGSWRATLEALPLLHQTWSEDGLEVGPLRDHFGEPV